MNINVGADMNIDQLTVHAHGGTFTLNQGTPAQTMPKLELTLTGISLEFRDADPSTWHLVKIWHVIDRHPLLAFEQSAQGINGQVQWNMNLIEPIDRVLWLTFSRWFGSEARFTGEFYISLVDIVVFCANNPVDGVVAFSNALGCIMKVYIDKNSMQRILSQALPGFSLSEVLAGTRKLVAFLDEVIPSQIIFNLVHQAEESIHPEELYVKSISHLLNYLNSLYPILVDLQDMKMQQTILDQTTVISSVVEEVLSAFLASPPLMIQDSIQDDRATIYAASTKISVTKTYLETVLKQAKDNVLKTLEQLKPVEMSLGTYCLPNTRILALEKLSTWAQGSPGTDQMFWLYGLAGTGKTTIAASFVQWLQSHKMLGAFFTCRRGHKALSSPLQLLQTICYGLSHVHKPYGRLVAQAISDDPYFGSGTATISSFFQQFFEGPLSTLGSILDNQVLVIVIDALDECGDVKERKELLQCLTKLMGLYSGLKVLVTSRANEEIQKALSGCSKSYQILSSDSNGDIETFFRFKCSDFEFNDTEIESLVKAAAGLFIWAETAFNYLNDMFDRENGLKAVLRKEPTSASPHAHLYQLYNTILCDSIPDKPENHVIFQRVLGAILLAVKPLTLDALVKMVQQPNISRKSIEGIVKQLHAVLQYSDHHKITVIHLSFSEYLLEHQCLERFRIDTTKQHFNLVDHCVQILSMQLKFNICGFESSYIMNSEVEHLQARINSSISMELQYASVYWVYHYIECDDLERGKLDEKLYILFQGWKALYWMEVVGLSDQIFSILKGLSTAEFKIQVNEQHV
ncbi:hypothetical protein BDN72DRAFT_813343 [Pluteus cervinus]|uniref:Uncharacterized protein n=1 Tax=Pluteus cervinus TaxID=181527 RepID=A0ACD3B8W5_9AGAR|nr:hypothetical protein BDN72DRAFT_813343 [Pluteus cervinus]